MDAPFAEYQANVTEIALRGDGAAFAAVVPSGQPGQVILNITGMITPMAATQLRIGSVLKIRLELVPDTDSGSSV